MRDRGQWSVASSQQASCQRVAPDQMWCRRPARPASQLSILDPRLSPTRAGITLIEMLVALAVTMLMMGAVVSIFAWIGDSVGNSRASIEIAERLRAARNRLQLDLQSATAQMDPPRRPESDEGYLEYVEGPIEDNDYTPAMANNVLGDTDDI